MRNSFLALLISGILVGCSPMTGVTSTALPQSASPSPSHLPLPLSSLETFMEREFGIPPDDVTVQMYESVEWSNACLDVPEPQEMCAEVITPGYRVIFDTPRGEFEFHTDESGDAFRLASGDLPQDTDAPPPPPGGVSIVPNASLITGRVLGSSIVEQTDASGTGLTLYVLEIEVLSSEAVEEGTPNLVSVAQVIEVYSKKDISFVEVGDLVEAEVRLAGDESGQSYWFREVTVITEAP